MSPRPRKSKQSQPPRLARIDKVVNDYLDKLFGRTRTEDDVLPGLAVSVR